MIYEKKYSLIWCFNSIVDFGNHALYFTKLIKVKLARRCADATYMLSKVTDR